MKTTVLITGSSGLMGFHLRALLQAKNGENEFKGKAPEYTILEANREAFAEQSKLVALVQRANIVIHLAGINRASEEEVEFGNVDLANKLVEALSLRDVVMESREIHLCYANSTHVDRDTAYGRGKMNAGRLLADWCSSNKSSFTNIIFPHIFGEGGQPNYNTVTATLCDRVASNISPEIHEGASVSLLHAGDAAELFLNSSLSKTDAELRPAGRAMLVKDLYSLLLSFSDTIANGVFPDLQNRLNLQLFNTYRYSQFIKKTPIRLKLNEDSRGILFEAAKGGGGGQTFLSWTNLGVKRGDHFHRRKVERFVVLSGSAEIRLRKLFSKEVHVYEVTGEQPVAIDIPTLYTHCIVNTGKEPLLTLFWAHEVFDPADTDTYMHLVDEAVDLK